MSKGGGYWGLDGAVLSGKASVTGAQPFTLDYPPNTPLVTRMELAAPLKRSFHCGRFGPLSPKIVDLKTRANATVSIELIDFQVTEVGIESLVPSRLPYQTCLD